MTKNMLLNFNIILAPKNDVTIALKNKFIEEHIEIIGFIDSYKNDEDILQNYKCGKNDLIIIYSPNYFKDIASSIKCNNIFIFSTNIINEAFYKDILPLNKFNKYTKIYDTNSLAFQKYHWENFLKTYNQKELEICGYEWGNPENDNDSLGNYKKIQKLLIKNINHKTNILEIGTLGGKWTNYMLNAQNIICVDINSYFINFLKNKFRNNINKFEFYITKGNELFGIKDNSIDFVFCMDTFVRVEKRYIYDYIKEIKRILNKKGKAIIHLPNSDIQNCIDRKFTNLNTIEITKNFGKYFDNFKIDSETIVHGSLVYINMEVE